MEVYCIQKACLQRCDTGLHRIWHPDAIQLAEGNTAIRKQCNSVHCGPDNPPLLIQAWLFGLLVRGSLQSRRDRNLLWGTKD